ncbi:efflux transporter outer membrane subunit [Herbaspirillum seropedicae]|uniref:efflux transporter outer membrane subunit n=1 Tax=Herbaspirillum seropedicae TaxID=964 RepID=UPI003FCD1F54
MSRAIYRHLRLLPALALCACAPLTAPPPPSALELPTHYPRTGAEDAQANTAQSASSIGWQDYFPQAPLQSLITEALRRHPDLRDMRLRLQQVQAQWRIQRSNGVPAVNLEAQARRSRGPLEPPESGPAASTREYRVGLGASSWELDFWGRIASLNEAALQEWMANRAAEQALVISLIGQVAAAWTSLRELDERLHLLQSLQAATAESLALMQARHDAGRGDAGALAQQRSELAQMRAEQAELQQMRASQRSTLAMLAGLTQLPATLEPTPTTVLLPVALAPGLPSTLLVARPDIIAAEHRLHASAAQVEAARAAFFPRISLTAFGGVASTALQDLFKGPSRAWNFVPEISLPLLDGGLRQSRYDIAALDQQRALLDYERTVQNAFREVAQRLEEAHWLKEQLRLRREVVQQQAQRQAQMHMRLRYGRASRLDVLESERDHLRAQQRQHMLEHALLRNQIALYVALGGGTQALSASSLYQQE